MKLTSTNKRYITELQYSNCIMISKIVYVLHKLSMTPIKLENNKYVSVELYNVFVTLATIHAHNKYYCRGVSDAWELVTKVT